MTIVIAITFYTTFLQLRYGYDTFAMYDLMVLILHLLHSTGVFAIEFYLSLRVSGHRVRISSEITK